MKINYIAIAEKAKELGACGVTNDLKLAAQNGEIEKANNIIPENITWLCCRPEMKYVMPKALWKIISGRNLPMKEMNNPDYVIKVCLKRIKENSNEN